MKTLKDEKRWGIVKVADEAKTPRSLVTRWRDGDWGQGRPTRETVERFCDNLGLKKEEPFGYMGWTIEPREAAAEARKGGVLEEKPEPDLDLMIRRIEIRLGQKPPAEERRDLELKLVRARRARDAKRLADELIAELEAEPDLTIGDGS